MEKQQTQHGTLKWSHGFLGLVLMFALFALLLSSLITTQYVVHFFQREMFPNSTLSTSNASACNVNKSTEDYYERTAVQKAASEYNIYKTLVEGIPSLIISGVLGGLGDKYGRSQMLIYSMSMSTLSGCIYSVIVYFEVDVHYLLVASAVYSLGGGLFGILSICFAYISDVTSPGKLRTLMITLLEASVGIGLAVSGFVSGFIIERIGFFYGSLCVGAASLCSLLVVIFFLPNSRPHSMLLSGTTSLENARASFEFYIRASPKRHKYILAIIIFMFATFSAIGQPIVDVLYQLNVPFCWSSVKVGYYSALANALRLIFGAASVKILQNCFKEEMIGILSSMSGMAACILEAFAINDTMLFMVPVTGCLGTIVIPMTRSIMSKLTPGEKQGALFAGIAAVEISANIASNLGASAIYIATVGTIRGFVFLVFAGCFVMTTFLLIVYRIINRRSQTVPLADTTKNIGYGTQTQIDYGEDPCH